MNQLDSYTPSRQLHVRLRAFHAAMSRAESWSGPSLTRRRRELRVLADKCGKRDQLEVVLRALHKQAQDAGRTCAGAA